MRFVGTYTSNRHSSGKGPAAYDPDDFSARKTGWKEYLKLCPAYVEAEGSPARAFVLERDPGFEVPRLRYGSTATISNCSVSVSGDRPILRRTEETEITPLDQLLKDTSSFLQSYTERSISAIDEMAYRLFGFPSMRPFQHRILEQVLRGKSILGIAATGGGKSECFILPAMLLSGITIVISPLRSLMADQYEQRIQRRYGLNHLTTYLNGDVEFRERQARLRRIELGYYKLVYMTPEQLERGYVLDSLKRADLNVGIRYIALDEAHCISQWGHDFRSSYLNIVKRLQSRGLNPVRIALTATASPNVRQDVCEELLLDPRPIEQGGSVFIKSSNRPELNLIVRVCPSTNDKVEGIVGDLQDLLRNNQKYDQHEAAIVFMPWTGNNPDSFDHTRGTLNRGRLSARVNDFASYLERQLTTKVAIYHGKMDADDDSTIVEDGTNSAKVKIQELGSVQGRKRNVEQIDFD